MRELTVYHFERFDGAGRTGVDIDGGTHGEHYRYAPGAPEDGDPVIRWSIDVRLSGDPLPGRLTPAWVWLLRHSAVIQAGLRDMAAALEIGFDPCSRPASRPAAGLPDGVTGAVWCSAARRDDARAFTPHLLALADGWADLLLLLEPGVALAG